MTFLVQFKSDSREELTILQNPLFSHNGLGPGRGNSHLLDCVATHIYMCSHTVVHSAVYSGAPLCAHMCVQCIYMCVHHHPLVATPVTGSTARHGTARHGRAWHGMAQHGVTRRMSDRWGMLILLISVHSCLSWLSFTLGLLVEF